MGRTSRRTGCLPSARPRGRARKLSSGHVRRSGQHVPRKSDALPRSREHLLFRIGELRKIRGRSIGCEVSLSERATAKSIKLLMAQLRLPTQTAGRDTAILRRYAKDMMASVTEVARILKPGGKAVYVIGNSTVRGAFIRNSTLIQAMAEQSGFVLSQKKVRLLPRNRRYLPPPSSFEAGDRLSTRMRQEVVLVFERRAQKT